MTRPRSNGKLLKEMETPPTCSRHVSVGCGEQRVAGATCCFLHHVDRPAPKVANSGTALQRHLIRRLTVTVLTLMAFMMSFQAVGLLLKAVSIRVPLKLSIAFSILFKFDLNLYS